MHKTAWIFAGQGAQRPGMGSDFFDTFQVFSDAFEEASDATGIDLKKLSLQGDDNTLKQTEVTQPLMLTFGVALARVAQQQFGAVADVAAGHSLGEITALCAAGTFELADAARLVTERGREMQACVNGADVAMAAVLGIDAAELSEICEAVSTPTDLVVCANFNAPGQTVLSGHRKAVERAAEQARAVGARRVLVLPVSAAFHSPLMSPMKERFLDLAGSISFRDTDLTLYANVDAAPYGSVHEVPKRLTDQLDAPVRWTDEVGAMVDAGVTRFVEFAPAPTLSSMVKRTTDRATAVTVANIKALETL